MAFQSQDSRWRRAKQVELELSEDLNATRRTLTGARHECSCRRRKTKMSGATPDRILEYKNKSLQARTKSVLLAQHQAFAYFKMHFHLSVILRAARCENGCEQPTGEALRGAVIA